MRKPKILCFVPMAPKRPKIFARTIQSIMNVYWNGPIEYMFAREDSPVEGPYDNICKKYSMARSIVLNTGYDALWTVESDIIVPSITLERLTRVEADVAYGLYASRHGSNRWLAFTHISETVGVSLSDDPINAKEAWGKVVQTAGVGLGCTLIWRRVLEKIEFRHPSSEVANDWFFSLDCLEYGFSQAHDLGVVCGHIVPPPSPKILWPDPDHPRLVQVEFFDEAPPYRVPPGETVVLVSDSFETRAVYREREEQEVEHVR